MLKLKLQSFSYLMQTTPWILGTPDAGKDWRQEEQGTTEYETVGCHHRLNGHEFEYTPGVGDGQGGLHTAVHGVTESDTTEQLNWTELSGSDSKQSVCNVGDMGSIPGWEDLLEKGMATHSSILTWRIPMDRGAWQAIVHVVTKSQTQLGD